jgi:hypothetical protein
MALAEPTEEHCNLTILSIIQYDIAVLQEQLEGSSMLGKVNRLPG